MSSRTLEAVCDARTTIAGITSKDEIYRQIPGVIAEILAFDACEVHVQQDGDLDIQVSSLDINESTGKPSISQAVADRTYQSQEPFLIGDTARTDQFDIVGGYRSILSVPLGDHGVLQLAAEEPDVFDEQVLSLADLIASYAATSLDGLQSESQPAPMSEQAQTLLDIADVLMVVLNPDGTISFTNRKARELLGYDEGDLIGQDWFETCIPERNRSEVREVFEQLMAGEVEPAERWENPVQTRDGDERLVEWHNAILPDDGGEIVGTVSSGVDVTERKKETRRRERLIDNLPGIVYRCRDETGWPMVSVEGNCEELTGYDASAIESGDISWGEDVIHPDDRQEVRNTIRSALEQERSFELTYCIVTRDGSQRWVWERGQCVPGESDDDPVLEGFITDITDRKKYEQQLREEREKYSTLVENSNDGIVIIQDGEFKFVNERFADIHDTTQDDLIGESYLSYIDPEYHDLVSDRYEQRLEGETPPTRYKVEILDGKRTLEINAARIEYDGRPADMGIVRDITDQVEYECTLTELNEATRELFRAESSRDLGRHVVETVTNVLNLAGAAFFLLDNTEGVLRPVAHEPPTEADDLMDDIPVFEPGESIAWRVFTEGASVLV